MQDLFLKPSLESLRKKWTLRFAGSASTVGACGLSKSFDRNSGWNPQREAVEITPQTPSLPDDRDSVLGERLIARHDRCIFGEGLGDEQAIERIPMVPGQLLDGGRVFECDR
jgi:hypothetical protein